MKKLDMRMVITPNHWRGFLPTYHRFTVFDGFEVRWMWFYFVTEWKL